MRSRARRSGKIVHVFPREKFTVDFVTMINDCLNEDDQHEFWLVGGTFELPTDFISTANVCGSASGVGLIRAIYSARKVVYHSLFARTALISMVLNWRGLDRSVWVIWGGDLYSYRRFRTEGLAGKLRIALRRGVARRLGGLGILADSDYQLAAEWYSIAGRKHRVRYIDYCDLPVIEELAQRENGDNRQRLIVVGNSATPSNRHAEAFRALAHLDSPEIQVAVPLSYGDAEYRDSVIRVGRELLPNSFVPMLDFWSKDRYLEFLSRVDVAIFNNDRQQALGNIRLLLRFGAKVYLSEDNPMYGEMQQALRVFPAESIAELSTDELFMYSPSDVEDARQRVMQFFRCEEAVDEWRSLCEMPIA